MSPLENVQYSYYYSLISTLPQVAFLLPDKELIIEIFGVLLFWRLPCKTDFTIHYEYIASIYIMNILHPFFDSSHYSLRYNVHLGLASTRLSFKLTFKRGTVLGELGAHASYISFMILAIVSLKGLNILQSVSIIKINIHHGCMSRTHVHKIICQKGFFYINKFELFPFALLV